MKYFLFLLQRAENFATHFLSDFCSSRLSRNSYISPFLHRGAVFPRQRNGWRLDLQSESCYSVAPLEQPKFSCRCRCGSRWVLDFCCHTSVTPVWKHLVRLKERTFASTLSDEAHQGKQSRGCCVVFSWVWTAFCETNPLAANRVGAREALSPRPRLSEVARLFAVCVLLFPNMKRECGLAGTFFLEPKQDFKAPRNVAHRIFPNKRNFGAHFNGSIPLCVHIRCCWCT